MTKPQHEQDYETVAKVLDANAPSPSRFESLSRLHTEAAKVPGLEAQLDAMKANPDTNGEHLQTSYRQIAEVAKLLDPEVCPDAWGLHAAAQKVVSERDAARQEVAQLAERVDGLKASLKASLANTEGKFSADPLYSGCADADEVNGIPMGTWRALAAYDAAKGGAPALSATDREQMNEVVELARQHGWDGVNNAKHLATFLSDRMADAAKYRAAVDGIQRARNLLLYPTAPWDETVPEVLRVLASLVSDTPPSGPGGGEPKDAAFEAWAQGQREADEQRREWARKHRPNPPDAPESSTLAPDLQRVVDATRATSERRAQRPRQPEPVPEVPALKAEVTKTLHVLTKDGLKSVPSEPAAPADPGLKAEACPCPDAPAQHKFSCRFSKPEVVWTVDGVRVLSNGMPEWLNQSAMHWWPLDKVSVEFAQVARALAEAKRDVERLNSERQETACDAIRRFASRLGDDATGYDTDRSLEELEVALYQHVMEEQDKAREQAAESMRERAEAQAFILARSHVDPNVRAACERLAHEIAALPLEKP